VSLWSRVRGWFRTDAATRASMDPNDDYVVLNGHIFYAQPGSFNTKLEDVENSFVGYVQHGYKANGVVFATIQARTLLFSEARFQWQPINSGRPGKLFGNQDLSILEYPWPNGTTGELLARMEQDVSLAGNFYCIRETDLDGDRLRRLRPDWVTIVLTAPADQATRSDIAGYWYHPGRTYGQALEREERDEYFTPDEMCHWSPIPDPEAQYRGMSWLTPVCREIQADGAATLHKLRFFHNGASPRVVFKIPAGVTSDQFKDFVTDTDRATGGIDNAYKNLYVGGGAEPTVIGTDLRQLDFSVTQGHGETRICAASRVPPIIVGMSEGLQAATYSNYGQARRAFGDHWARPQWRSACAALEKLVAVPPGPVRLWYDDRDIAFLREDQRDAAEIQQIKAATIGQLISIGFAPDSAVAAVDADDRSLLVHTGLVSVQLQPPGTALGTPSAAPKPPPSVPINGANKASPNGAVNGAARTAGGHDDEQLHHYWTRGEGLAKWIGSPTPWTTLEHHLEKYVGPERAKEFASRWFIEVFGYAAGSDKNRVAHGKPPRGHLVGPG
jgi:phage portal protein BeeE